MALGKMKPGKEFGLVEATGNIELKNALVKFLISHNRLNISK